MEATGAKMIATSLYQDDESRWQAVRTRNAHADGLFFYGVRSTRIYCRPACKARLARRANVSFYDDAAGAQAAGFRPCKRCKPEVVGFMPEEKAVRRIREFVIASAVAAAEGEGEGEETETGERMSLASMAKEVGLSKWHFHRVFKKCVGVTPVEYLRVMRQRRREDLTGSAVAFESIATAAAGEHDDLSWLGDFSLDNADILPDGGLPLSTLGTDLDSSSSSSHGLSASESLDVDASLDDILSWPDDWWNTPIR
jgi:methylphosphotriester-DNA--protein-cysteine methyltransferase